MRIRKHLSYSNVVATLALVIAVAGGTTAIAGKVTAPKSSVTNKSIRDGNVTAKELAGLTLVHADTQFTDVAANDGNFASGQATAHCPAGWRVINGSGSTGGNRVVLQGSGPNLADGWLANAASDNGSTAHVVADAYCLPPRPSQPFKLP